MLPAFKSHGDASLPLQRPFTDSSSFAESYPTPSLNTISTFSMSAMVLEGAPEP
jgi:hypothetical protein